MKSLTTRVERLEQALLERAQTRGPCALQDWLKHAPVPDAPKLLSPEDTALLLLEAATLESFRSGGEGGLSCVTEGRKRMFRASDVEDFIKRRFAA